MRALRIHNATGRSDRAWRSVSRPAAHVHAGMNYSRFIAMVLTATVVMYGLMYLNTYSTEHLFFSQTRAWMAVIMGATMAIVMLAFMRGMYHNATANTAIYTGSALALAAALWLVRSQDTVDDVAYMKAMIPHHSIAIMTSRRAQISDPRVRELADGIIETQIREIDELEQLIIDIEKSGKKRHAQDIPAEAFRPSRAPRSGAEANALR